MIRRINRRKIFFLTFVSMAYLLAIVWVDTAASQNCKPLLLPGKKTLFQRVITNPGANVYVSTGKKAAIVHASVKPFTIYYVYERRQVEGAEWVKVGPSASCEISGWVEGSLVSEWRQSLSLVFTERVGRKPVLFFKDLDALEKVAGSPSPADEAAKLATQFTNITAGKTAAPEDFPIIAMEPQQEAVSRQRFYLMPIFQTVELFEGVKFLEAASIDPGSWELTGNSELRTAVVFVIDTTISMKPYIERTREAVRRIYDAIESSGLSDKVAFGLVAFRSSVEKTPGVEYVSKVVSDLKDGRQRGAFEAALADTREAEVSTHSFNEDALAGLKTAMEALNWKPYQSRLIFLITDAGAIRNDDPYSTTGMNEPEIADLAAAKGVKIFVLHIKTPLGKKINNHSYAEAQYKALTGQTDPSIGDLYVPVDASKAAVGVQTFGRLVEGVAVQMVELVRATSAGQRLQLPGQSSSDIRRYC